MATTKTATKKNTKAASAKKSAKSKIKTVVETAKGKKAANAKSDRKLSAIDAAAKVLGESKEPLSTKQMIDVMASKRLWTSPGGKTPHATLYSAILREINTKGKDARFVKTERGRFTTSA